MPRHSRLVHPFAKSSGCESAMGEAGGESARGLLVFAWKTAQFDKPRYTGTKPTALGAEISRSSASLTKAYATNSQTVRRLPRQ